MDSGGEGVLPGDRTRMPGGLTEELPRLPSTMDSSLWTVEMSLAGLHRTVMQTEERRVQKCNKSNTEKLLLWP